MKLTAQSEYSLLALVYLARNQKDGYVKIENICREYELSKKYLEQIFLSLKQNRLLKTRTGANGGYRLTRPPEEITLAEIIRLMDGALAPSTAVSIYFYEQTPLEKEKKAVKVFKRIRDYIARQMEKLTIADLV